MVIIKQGDPPHTSDSNTKFEFTGNYQEISGKRVWQIKRKTQGGDGALGGYIEKEENLDFKGMSWIGPEAKVYGNAKITGDASIYGNAIIGDEALVSGNAHVYG